LSIHRRRSFALSVLPRFLTAEIACLYTPFEEALSMHIAVMRGSYTVFDTYVILAGSNIKENYRIMNQVIFV
jgi:hypothetical protein